MKNRQLVIRVTLLCDPLCLAPALASHTRFLPARAARLCAVLRGCYVCESPATTPVVFTGKPPLPLLRQTMFRGRSANGEARRLQGFDQSVLGPSERGGA